MKRPVLLKTRRGYVFKMGFAQVGMIIGIGYFIQLVVPKIGVFNVYRKNKKPYLRNLLAVHLFLPAFLFVVALLLLVVLIGGLILWAGKLICWIGDSIIDSVDKVRFIS